jgi:hypothetical protein
MVRSCTGWKRLSVNCSSRHDFPTPATQTNKRPTDRSIAARIDRHRLPHDTRAADPQPRGSNPISPARVRPAGIRGAAGSEARGRRTCVADDDVLEEVGVRHPRSIGSGRSVPAAAAVLRRRVPEDSVRSCVVGDLGLGVVKAERERS